MNSPMEMIQKFNQFKQTFTEDPKEEVMKLLQSGQMSQNQLNQLQMMAKEFEKLIK